jgi:hypothetical protein
MLEHLRVPARGAKDVKHAKYYLERKIVRQGNQGRQDY